MRETNALPLGDYVTLTRGTTYKGALVGQPGPALLGLGSIQPGGGFRESDFKTYGGECPEALRLYPGDMFAALKGATKDGKMIGSVARVPTSVPVGRLTQDTVKLKFTRPDQQLEQYIYWVLRTPQYREYCAGRAMGSAVVAMSRTDFLTYPIPTPTASRHHLVSLFELIEARITLLREINATLEAIAQALFKSWFVDFDPVRAKRDGCAPEGMDEATAALFPGSFEDSELGKVPRGWEVRAIGDCIDTVGGATPDTKNAAFWSPEEFAWTTPKDLSGATSPALISTGRRLSTAGLAKISSGLLPKGSLLMSSRAPIGYLAIADLPVAINQGYIGMLPGGRLPPLYMLRWCQAHMDQIKGRANGSTFMEISKKAFRPIPAVVPHREVIAAYTAMAQPLFDRVIANERQALTLIQVRDTLLPRLISGQLRLPAVESEVAALQ